MNFNEFIAKNNERKWKIVLLIAVSILIAAAFTGFLLEYFQREENVKGTITWISTNYNNFIISNLFIISVYFFILAVTGKLQWSLMLCTFIFILMGYANIKKISSLGEPLYPADFYHILYIKSLFNVVKGEISLQSIGFNFVFGIILIYLLKRTPKVKINIITRIILLPVTVLIMYSYLNYDKNFIKVFADKADIEICLWNQPYNYNTNGFVFGMLSNLQNKIMEKPEGYNKENLETIINKYKNQADIINKSRINSDNIEPNILFILGETFWDPTKLSNFKFSEDPMKNIRSIMEQSSSGAILSPSFGGETANVEFESLTGMSMYNLISGTSPYQQVLDKKKFVPSLVSVFKNRGYYTTAIHPYDKVFYKRNKVYTAFGFDNFISQTEMNYKETYGSDYISDQAVFDEMLDILVSSEKPVFIHAVTMQNHLPVSEGKFGVNTISISGADTVSVKELETYSEGIKWTDKAIKNLIDKLSKINEPTIVVFYGDHLPAFKNSVYEEGGLSKKDNFNKEKVFFETPLFIYSNYKTNKQALNVVSPAFLGVTLFDILGKPLSPYEVMLNQIKKEIPALKSDIILDFSGNIKMEISEEEKALLQEYKLIQYDLLEGEQYSLNEFFQD